LRIGITGSYTREFGLFRASFHVFASLPFLVQTQMSAAESMLCALEELIGQRAIKGLYRVAVLEPVLDDRDAFLAQVRLAGALDSIKSHSHTARTTHRTRKHNTNTENTHTCH
jgi:hypothetical protein